MAVEEHPRYAYDPEAQEIIVHSAQQAGFLTERTVKFERIEIVDEMDLRWYIFYPAQAAILSDDCNENVLSQLKEGDSLTYVHTTKTTLDPLNKRNIQTLAAALVGDQLLYTSRGFNHQAYELGKQTKNG